MKDKNEKDLELAFQILYRSESTFLDIDTCPQACSTKNPEQILLENERVRGAELSKRAQRVIDLALQIGDEDIGITNLTEIIRKEFKWTYKKVKETISEIKLYFR